MLLTFRNSRLRFLIFCQLFCLSIFFPEIVSAEKACIKGSCFFKQIEIGNKILPLRGLARFNYYIFRVYDGALYYPAGLRNLSLGDTVLRLELRYLRSISRDDLIQPSREYLKEHIPDNIFSNIQDRVEEINKFYQPVEEGDKYALEFIPGQGTSLYFNGDKKVTIPGDDFAKAYFGIWLAKDTAAQKFRKKIINQLEQGVL